MDHELIFRLTKRKKHAHHHSTTLESGMVVRRQRLRGIEIEIEIEIEIAIEIVPFSYLFLIFCHPIPIMYRTQKSSQTHQQQLLPVRDPTTTLMDPIPLRQLQRLLPVQLLRVESLER